MPQKDARDSDVLRTAAQIAASTYDGPGGAAAFAAWYAYNATGDANLALRVGLISGLTSAGFNAAGELPSDTVGQAAKKIIVTAAVGGGAAVASGADGTGVKNAMLSGAVKGWC